MKKIVTLTALLGSLTLGHAQNYDANLDGLQEVPPNASPAYGSSDFILSGTSLSVAVAGGNYVDLLGGATVITISDAAAGANGPTIFTLTATTPGSTTGTFTGSGTLTAGQVTDLNAGNLYVNVRSQVFPSGEIRGQLGAEAVPEPSVLALLAPGVAALLAIRRRAG